MLDKEITFCNSYIDESEGYSLTMNCLDRNALSSSEVLSHDGVQFTLETVTTGFY